MAKYRIIRTEFWKNPLVMEAMSPNDKYFYLYLLTNPQTTQIGIYRITKKQMAFDLGLSMEDIQELMDRFIEQYKLICYNPETRELAIKNWGKDNLVKGGKPVMDCIVSELKNVEDRSLIRYVSESIRKQDICSLYESFYKQDELFFCKEDCELDDMNTYIPESELVDDSLPCRQTIRGQKEKQKQKEKEKQQNAFNLNIENNPSMDKPFTQDTEAVKEIIEYWDGNGFGFTNINAKEQLLSWLDDSSFLQPKEVILKAMNIACGNNKRKLNYVVGILKNWKNESLLTIEEIDAYCKNEKSQRNFRQASESSPVGRIIPGEFILDLTAGEE